jgi:hypothetical protein
MQHNPAPAGVQSNVFASQLAAAAVVQNVFAINLVVEQVEAEIRFCLRLEIRLPLKPPVPFGIEPPETVSNWGEEKPVNRRDTGHSAFPVLSVDDLQQCPANLAGLRRFPD